MNTLIKKVIGESDITLGTQVDPADMKRLLQMVRDRFIDERTRGFIHPETGEYIAPVSQQDAVRRWQAVAQNFEKLFGNIQPGSRESERLGVRHTAAPARYTHPEAQ